MWTIMASFLGLCVGTAGPGVLSAESMFGMDMGVALQLTMAQFILVYAAGM